MKVALCISGQPRSAEEAYPYIYQNIILPNQADVFIHMNYSPTNQYIERSHVDNPTKNTYYADCIDKKVLALYNPIAYMIEDPKSFSKPQYRIPQSRMQHLLAMNSHKGWTEEEQRAYSVKQMTSMYYSIFKCNELKETYAMMQGVIYDYVIRIRFDAKPMCPLYCHTYDPHYLYYQDLGQPDQLVSDWINFGSNAVMNVFSSMYFMMDYLNTFEYYPKDERLANTYEASDTVPGSSEYALRDLMTRMNIPCRSFSVGCALI